MHKLKVVSYSSNASLSFGFHTVVGEMQCLVAYSFIFKFLLFNVQCLCSLIIMQTGTLTEDTIDLLGVRPCYDQR